MAYGLPHGGEKVQFLYEDTADVSANGHASRTSVTVPHQNIPTISPLWVFFRFFFFSFFFYASVKIIEARSEFWQMRG